MLQTMMTQCPVRALMTEIYALLLELGPPLSWPSETFSCLYAEGRHKSAVADPANDSVSMSASVPSVHFRDTN